MASNRIWTRPFKAGDFFDYPDIRSGSATTTNVNAKATDDDPELYLPDGQGGYKLCAHRTRKRQMGFLFA